METYIKATLLWDFFGLFHDENALIIDFSKYFLHNSWHSCLVFNGDTEILSLNHSSQQALVEVSYLAVIN